MKKIRLRNLENIERFVYDWIYMKRFRFMIFGLFVLLVFVVSHAPFINLFFNNYLFALIFILFTPLILDLDDKLFFAVVIFLIIVVTLLLIINQVDKAQRIIEYAFIFVLAGTVKVLFSSQ